LKIAGEEIIVNEGVGMIEAAEMIIMGEVTAEDLNRKS